jgi:hypothetical protein
MNCGNDRKALGMESEDDENQNNESFRFLYLKTTSFHLYHLDLINELHSWASCRSRITSASEHECDFRYTRIGTCYMYLYAYFSTNTRMRIETAQELQSFLHIILICGVPLVISRA